MYFLHIDKKLCALHRYDLMTCQSHVCCLKQGWPSRQPFGSWLMGWLGWVGSMFRPVMELFPSRPSLSYSGILFF